MNSILQMEPSSENGEVDDEMEDEMEEEEVASSSVVVIASSEEEEEDSIQRDKRGAGRAAAAGATKSVWQCHQCNSINPVARKVCKICKRMRGSHSHTFEISEEDSKADSARRIFSHAEVFHAPVFLSLDFQQLLTGRPTLHKATSVPQDGQLT